MSNIEQEASEIIAARGELAPQFLVERIVAAARSGADRELDRLDKILQEVDRVQGNRL